MSTSMTGQGPGQRPVSFGGIVVLAAYFTALAVVLLWQLVALWPEGPMPAHISSPAQPAASATAAGTEPPGLDVGPAATQDYGPPGKRLLLLIVLTGALGGVLHALRSLSWYVGNRNLIASWTLLYLLLPLVSAILAAMVYFVVRGSLLTVEARPQGYVGFVALAGLTGLFSQQAIVKLKDVAERFFAPAPPGGNATPQGTAAPPTPSLLTATPDKPSVNTSAQTLAFTGTGFVAPLTLVLTSPGGGVTTIGSAEPRNISPTSFEVDLKLDTPGAWLLEVTNGRGESSAPFSVLVS